MNHSDHSLITVESMKGMTDTEFVLIGDPSKYSKLLNSTKIELKKSDNLFLKTIIDYYTETNFINDIEVESFTVNRLSKATLLELLKHKKIGSAKSSVSARSEKLTDIGVFDRISFKISESIRAKPVLVFRPIADIIQSEIQDAPAESNKGKALRALRENTELSLENVDMASSITYEETKAAYMPKTWGYLLNLLSISRTKVNKVSSKFPNSNMSVSVESTVDAGICKHMDARTILHISTYCTVWIKTQVELGLKPENQFMIDVVDMCHMAGLNPVGKNRETIRKSLNRMYFTNYQFTGVRNDELEKMGIPKTEENYKFLTELNTSYDQEKRGTEVNPRWFKISISNSVFNAIVEHAKASKGEIFLWHKDLLRYPNGLALIMYQAFNRMLPRSAKNLSARSYNETELHQELAPHSSLDRFRALAFDMYCYMSNEKLEPDYSGTLKFSKLGFKTTFILKYGSLELVTVERDQADPLTGANSKHKRLAAANLKQDKEKKPSKSRPSDKEQVAAALSNIQDTNW